MRPQDIVILLKKVTLIGRDMTNAQVAKDLGISASEVSEALERCRIADLWIMPNKGLISLHSKSFLYMG